MGAPNWEAWRFLLGEWVAEGGGEPRFRFTYVQGVAYRIGGV